MSPRLGCTDTPDTENSIFCSFCTGTYYATSRKGADSIPDGVIGFFNRPNPSSRTMALESTQPLTEVSTRKFPGG
jgi:hypothetical protein